jgi:hypothetical protein
MVKILSNIYVDPQILARKNFSVLSTSFPYLSGFIFFSEFIFNKSIE